MMILFASIAGTLWLALMVWIARQCWLDSRNAFRMIFREIRYVIYKHRKSRQTREKRDHRQTKNILTIL